MSEGANNAVNQEDKVAQLERRLVELEQAVAQLIGTIKTVQAVQQTAPPPPPPMPDPSVAQQPSPGMPNPGMIAALAPLLELFKPQGSKLDELVVGKALELLFRSTELNNKFMENLMEALSSAFGKKAGERIAKVIAVAEE
jgi:hypothetical protein